MCSCLSLRSRDSWANSQKLTLEIKKIPKINIFDDLLYKSQESKCFWKYAVIKNNFIAHVHVATLQLGEGIYQGERKLYLHFVCSLLISEGTQKVLRWQKFCIDLIKNFPNLLTFYFINSMNFQNFQFSCTKWQKLFNS